MRIVSTSLILLGLLAACAPKNDPTSSEPLPENRATSSEVEDAAPREAGSDTVGSRTPAHSSSASPKLPWKLEVVSTGPSMQTMAYRLAHIGDRVMLNGVPLPEEAAETIHELVTTTRWEAIEPTPTPAVGAASFSVRVWLGGEPKRIPGLDAAALGALQDAVGPHLSSELLPLVDCAEPAPGVPRCPWDLTAQCATAYLPSAAYAAVCGDDA